MKFLIKNFIIWTYFYSYLYSSKSELNLEFKFKESILTPRNFNTFISFSYSESGKDLYAKEVYEIFINYLNCFEIINKIKISLKWSFLFMWFFDRNFNYNSFHNIY